MVARRMAHPKDRLGLTRRQLLHGAAGTVVGASTLGLLAGCENTTGPIGGGTAQSNKFVVSKPLGPGGLPLPRPDNSVTWAITADNEPVAEGRPVEKGPLTIYNYADYIWPGLLKKFEKRYGTKVQLATYNSSDEAIAKLASGQVSFDVVLGLSGSNIVNLIAQQLLQPLNHAYLPNLPKNIWPELQDPFYDRGSRYTVPYVVWLDGIGWRNDKIKTDIAGMDVPWDIFWHSQAYRGRVGLLDDKRDGLSMPMQRDAIRAGISPDLNTEDPALVAKAGRDLQELVGICNIKVTITDYQTLPEGKTWLHHSWSGDVIGAAIYYMPKGVKPDVLSFWGPEHNGVVQNDFLCIGRKSQNPVLAHTFIDFVLDEKNAYDNFVQQNGYIPPQKNIDAELLIKQGLIPKSLASAVTRPEQFAFNQELLQLSVPGERLWDDAWSKFKAG
jgi:spermidine/putrescine transport system substrate-binding protein